MFRRNIERTAKDLPGSRQPLGATIGSGNPSDTEVKNFGLKVNPSLALGTGCARQYHVGRFDVAVHQPFAMSFGQTVANAQGNLQSFIYFQLAAPLQVVFQALTLHELHDHIGGTFTGDTIIFQTDQVWVIETAGCLCFRQKAPGSGFSFFLNQLRIYYFNGHNFIKIFVPGLEDRTHAASSEPLQHLILFRQAVNYTLNKFSVAHERRTTIGLAKGCLL